MKILAISGSLRKVSSNTALLRAMGSLAPTGMEIILYEGLGSLPPFNPDLDNDNPPEPVADFRKQLSAVDGVLISSPEYVFSIPGVLKNALDWIVSSGEFTDKPVVLINASTGGGEKVQAALIEILGVMMAKVLVEASLLGPIVRKPFDAQGNLSDPKTAQALRTSLEVLASVIDNLVKDPTL